MPERNMYAKGYVWLFCSVNCVKLSHFNIEKNGYFEISYFYCSDYCYFRFLGST